MSRDLDAFWQQRAPEERTATIFPAMKNKRVYFTKISIVENKICIAIKYPIFLPNKYFCPVRAIKISLARAFTVCANVSINTFWELCSNYSTHGLVDDLIIRFSLQFPKTFEWIELKQKNVHEGNELRGLEDLLFPRICWWNSFSVKISWKILHRTHLNCCWIGKYRKPTQKYDNQDCEIINGFWEV